MTETPRDIALRLLSDQLGLSDREKQAITDKTFLLNIGMMDSLDVVELVMNFEDELDLEIPDAVVEKLVTFGDLVATIQENVNGSV
jgi:acyl carrier protein